MPIELDEIKLAYCAALLDGEGHIQATVSRNHSNGYETRIISVNIRMTDLEPLEKFRSGVGGLGKIYGPYREKNWPDHYKSNYVYKCQKFGDVQFILAAVWTWLSEPKREQARNALKKYKTLKDITIYTDYNDQR